MAIFQATLYGSDKNFGNTPLIADLITDTNIVKVDFTQNSNYINLLQVMEGRTFENETENFWSGGKHVTNEYSKTWQLISKPIPLFNNQDKIDSTELFLDSLWEKDFKYLDIMDYKIRPKELISDDTRCLRVNITETTMVRENGNLQYKITCEGVK